jgi:hypothetical protein
MASRFRRGFVAHIRDAWNTHVIGVGNEARMIATVSFIVAFAAVRIVTHTIRGGIGPFFNLEPGGVHVHHMVPGLVLVLVAGILMLSEKLERTRALLFGVGAALVLDEFALLLNLADVYWAPEGRESIDAVILFGALLVVYVLGGEFWPAALRSLRAREQKRSV